VRLCVWGVVGLWLVCVVVCGCVVCGVVVCGVVVLFVCLYMGDFARLCACVCVCVSLCLCVNLFSYNAYIG
jgi:hypothetical protein